MEEETIPLDDTNDDSHKDKPTPTPPKKIIHQVRLYKTKQLIFNIRKENPN